MLGGALNIELLWSTLDSVKRVNSVLSFLLSIFSVCTPFVSRLECLRFSLLLEYQIAPLFLKTFACVDVEIEKGDLVVQRSLKRISMSGAGCKDLTDLNEKKKVCSN